MPHQRAGRARRRLLVVGEINADIVVLDADPRPAFGQTERLVESVAITIGSSSVITACGAARLGLATSFVGVVGDDPLGRFMLAEMEERGLDVRACLKRKRERTGVTVVLSDGRDRAMLTMLGTIGAVGAEHVPAGLLARADHLHVGSYYLQERLRPDLPELLAAARSAGTTTSLDPNWDPAGRWDGIDAGLLAGLDLLLPNAEEAKRITGADDPETAAARLASLADSGPGDRRRPLTVAMKIGSAGALARRGAEVVRLRALPIEPVDTTGAGDSFDAGFLFGHLNGWPLEAALALAVACGSLSTRAAGGTDGQPTLDEARAAAEAAGSRLPSA